MGPRKRKEANADASGRQSGQSAGQPASNEPHDPATRASLERHETTIDSSTQGAERRVWTGENRILAALPAEELRFMKGNLSPVSLATGQILYEQKSRIDAVYFPETAVASVLSRMGNDAVVEVGTIGNEGVVGLSLALGEDISLQETISQIPGAAQRMPAADFRSALAKLPRLREIMAKCTHAFMTQVSQTAACNRLHGIEQRCARWLLLTHDRVGGADTFPLTHQFLSFMLGVRRAGVTEALGALTQAGLIKSTNGRISVLDRAGLEGACCECYAIVRLHSGERFGAAAPAD